MLNASKIKAHIASGDIMIEPYDEQNLRNASYVLSLGTIQPKANEVHEYTLKPGEFIIGYTLEKVAISSHIASLLSVRGKCAAMGINSLNSDLFVEPEWSGKLRVIIHNISDHDVELVHGMKLIKCIFFKLD